MSLPRLIAAIALGSLALTLALATLEPPLGVIAGALLGGVVVGVLVERAALSLLSGALAGLAGFTLAYGIGGGGYLGVQVYRELLGSIGPLIPPAYYLATTGATAALVTLATERLKRRTAPQIASVAPL